MPLDYFITHCTTGEKWNVEFTENDAAFVGTTLENATEQSLVLFIISMNIAQENHNQEFKYSLS